MQRWWGGGPSFYAIFNAKSTLSFPHTPYASWRSWRTGLRHAHLVPSSDVGAVGAVGADNPANIRPESVTDHRWWGFLLKSR